MKNKPIIALLCLVAIALGIRGHFILAKIDRNAPIITYKDTEITYTEGEPDSELLADVIAIDKVDGDVSDTLIVEKVTADENEKEAVVTYAAIDRKNNLAKLNRVVKYEKRPDPNQKPVQGDTPNETPKPSDPSNHTESGSSMVLRDAPVMLLNNNSFTIYQNDKFTIRSFIARIIDDKDSEKALMNNVKKEGSFNTAVKGEYSFKIYVIDSDGNESNKEQVTLIVE